ncbi:MAG: FixH family protein [candidate division NC10 bacterium]|nr:FixH family protein [candidate division NC10 bacterium]
MCPVKRAIGLLLLTLPLLAGCGLTKRGTADLAVTLVSEPSPPRVGENVLRARVSGRDGGGVSVSGVRFHYYPFVHRDKDSLASPDEVVRVLEGTSGEGGYRAKATFDKPGLWKVTLKIVRPDRPEAILTFTYDVRA